MKLLLAIFFRITVLPVILIYFFVGLNWIIGQLPTLSFEEVNNSVIWVVWGFMILTVISMSFCVKSFSKLSKDEEW